MSVESLLSELQEATGLAKEILRLEDELRTKKEKLDQVVGKTVGSGPLPQTASSRQLQTGGKTLQPAPRKTTPRLRALGPEFSRASVAERIREFLRINAGVGVKVPLIAEMIGAMTPSTVGQLLVKEAKRAGTKVKRIGPGLYAWQD